MFLYSVPMKVSFDTGMIVNCVLSEESLNVVAQMWGQSGHTFVIPSATEVGNVISKLGMERKFTTKVDEDEGKKLTKKYGKDENGKDNVTGQIMLL